MSENVKQVKEEEISIKDVILTELTGKVAEMKSAMDENSVQFKKLNEMVSKLPSFEKRLEAVENSVQAVTQKAEEVVNRVGSISVPAESIGALRQELVDRAQLFEKPLRKEVHYRHILGWPIVVVLLALMFALFMFVSWQKARYQVSAEGENDIKYRFMKLSGDSVVRTRLNVAEEAWQADPEQFRNAVETDEQVMMENTINYLRKMKLDSVMRAVKRPRDRR